MRSRLLFSLLLVACCLVGLTVCPARSATATTGDISGTVVDGSKNPVPNATVRVTAGPMLLTARSGANGKYTLSGLAPGQYEITAQKPAYNPVHKSAVNVTVNAVTTLNFTLAWGNLSAAGAEVIVKGPGGTLLPDADVALFSNGALVDRISTDEVGSAVFPGLAPAFYQAQVQRPGYQAKTTAAIKLVAGGMTTFSPTLKADPNQVGQLGGVVENTDTQTLAKVAVKILSGITQVQAVTGKQGRYMFSNLVPGIYTVQYSLDGYQTQIISGIVVNALSTTEIDPTLLPVQPQKGSITGKVVDTQGVGIAFATVLMTAGPAAGESLQTAQDGAFTFTGLTPSPDYALVAEQSGYSPVGVSAITVTKGQTTVVNFQLTNQTIPPGSVTGTVRDSASTVALSGVRVDILQGPSTGLATTTDASGEYLLQGLIPGQNYTLRFTKAGYLVATYPLVTITSGLRTTQDASLTAQVATTGGISGVVTKAADGTALKGATVDLFQGPSSPLSTTTDANGAYSFKNLRPGTGYGIHVSKTGFITATQTSIKVSNGLTTTVGFSLKKTSQLGSIHGAAVDLGLNPVTNATVRLSGGPTQADPVTTDATGQFEFDNLAAGTYSVQITSANHPTTTKSGVVVTPGQTTEVLFHFNE